MNQLSTTKIGTISEIKACAWLMTQGYEVFRGIHADGPADIVAYKNGQFIPIDVKTLTDTFRNFHGPLSDYQVHLGIRLLTVDRATGECTLYPLGIKTAYRCAVRQSRKGIPRHKRTGPYPRAETRANASEPKSHVGEIPAPDGVE